MKFFLIVIQATIIGLIPNLLRDYAKPAEYDCFFSDIKKYGHYWNTIINKESIMYETEELESGKLQVTTDMSGRIKSIRWAVTFNIRIASTFKKKTIGKILLIILSKENLDWIDHKLYGIDKYPVVDHYHSRTSVNRKLTINHTKLHQHLDVMIKIN